MKLRSVGVVKALANGRRVELVDVLAQGELLHVAGYRGPKAYAGKRVIVVGAGNSAVEVGYELAEVATTTLAVRTPVQFVPQIRGGRDMHYWPHTLRLDLLPPAVLCRTIRGTPVFDTGIYRLRWNPADRSSGRCSPHSKGTRSSGPTTSDSVSMR